MLFVKPEVRKGLLGRMLTELLDTRVMVKQAMKNVNDRVRLSRRLTLIDADNPIGTQEGPRRPSALSQVHSKCHVWLHKRVIFWTHAGCRGCRRDRADRKRDARKGDSHDPILMGNALTVAGRLFAGHTRD